MTDILKALEYTGREGAARIEIESLRARVTELEADISEIPQICRRYERQLTELKAGQGDPFIWISQGLELSDHKRDGFRPLYTSAPNIHTLNEREVELIDGMISIQLDHAERCDRIANVTMGTKQKAWDMERVNLLQKIKSMLSAAPEYKGEADWSTQKKWGE